MRTAHIQHLSTPFERFSFRDRIYNQDKRERGLDFINVKVEKNHQSFSTFSRDCFLMATASASERRCTEIPLISDFILISNGTTHLQLRKRS